MSDAHHHFEASDWLRHLQLYVDQHGAKIDEAVVVEDEDDGTLHVVMTLKPTPLDWTGHKRFDWPPSMVGSKWPWLFSRGHGTRVELFDRLITRCMELLKKVGGAQW